MPREAPLFHGTSCTRPSCPTASLAQHNLPLWMCYECIKRLPSALPRFWQYVGALKLRIETWSDVMAVQGLHGRQGKGHSRGKSHTPQGSRLVPILYSLRSSSSSTSKPKVLIAYPYTGLSLQAITPSFWLKHRRLFHASWGYWPSWHRECQRRT